MDREVSSDSAELSKDHVDPSVYDSKRIDERIRSNGTDDPLFDFEMDVMNRTYERVVALAEQNGTIASGLRNYMNILNIEIRIVLDFETPERREKANKELVSLAFKIQQSRLGIHAFRATVTVLLQQDNVNINATSSYGRTLLFKICRATNISHSYQYDAIMFLLANGADPNRGSVLRWVSLRYLQNKCTELEFAELFNKSFKIMVHL
jgi:hypothetical protein